MKDLLSKNSCPGFTLIELIVSVAIISILTAIGIASYTSFQQTQELKTAASELKNNLRFYQNKALAGENADLCGANDFYGYNIIINSSFYEAYVTCSVGEGDGNIQASKKTYNLPANITINLETTGNLTFKAMTGGIESAREPFIINLCGYGKLYTITVDQSGNIQDEGISGTCSK